MAKLPAPGRDVRRVAAAAAVVFLVLAVVVALGWSPIIRTDGRVAGALVRWLVPSGTGVAALSRVSEVFHPTVFRVVAVLGAGWLWQRSRRGGIADPAPTRRLALYVLVTVEVGGLLARGCKELVARPRPVPVDPVAHASGYSFPSGHAFGVMVAAVVLLVAVGSVTGRRPGVLWWSGAAVVVAVTGFARLGLGVHFLSDVLGGYLLGLAWALGMAALLHPWAVLPTDGSPARCRAPVPGRLDGRDRVRRSGSAP
ncbi:phosphatase PAP2 family protein [Frankia sp. AgKG'84/4]|uniref:phosphatase PAP2 family protein n=1 Tax=Frankia sp. AgKG'84/4 TaxID=573490 RepID=UPI00200FCF40|nr:phosphatase PAP2 family protein [Frankia sp. AgKG'84/4]MCL9796755.1 phosphatase PAP2 family protein [Frankia sp. AgKG'84/4]